MKIQWTLAAVLSSALIVACSEKQAENSPNADQASTGPAATETTGDVAVSPAEPSSTNDAPAVPNSPAARPNASRPAPARPSQPATRPGTQATTGSTSAALEPRPEASTPRAPEPAAPRWRDVTVATGTALPLELLTAVSSETAAVEAPVRARVRQAVSIDGVTVIPANAIVHGNVTAVERAGRVRGRSQLAFRFTEVEIAGAREELRTNVLAFEGEETKGEDATKVGAGAVGGAIIGGILGGGDGAAKGAIIGGAAGTGAVLATRGREVSLASGTSLAASLAQPFTIRVRE